MGNKDMFDINRETLRKIYVDPDRGVEYLLNKKAININPAHVKALDVLKVQHVPSS